MQIIKEYDNRKFKKYLVAVPPCFFFVPFDVSHFSHLTDCLLIHIATKFLLVQRYLIPIFHHLSAHSFTLQIVDILQKSVSTEKVVFTPQLPYD